MYPVNSAVMNFKFQFVNFVYDYVKHFESSISASYFYHCEIDSMELFSQVRANILSFRYMPFFRDYLQYII